MSICSRAFLYTVVQVWMLRGKMACEVTEHPGCHPLSYKHLIVLGSLILPYFMLAGEAAYPFPSPPLTCVCVQCHV